MTKTLYIVDSIVPHLHQAAEMLEYRQEWQIHAASSQVLIANPRLAIHADVLLIELQLPAPSYQFPVAALKRLLPKAAIVVTVPFGDEEMAARAMHDGADDFLHKPIKADRLFVTLTNICALKELSNQRHIALQRQPPLKSQHAESVIAVTDQSGRVRSLRDLDSVVTSY